MYRIPDETLTAIREQADIVQIVSQYLQLRKSGQNHFASCPFHDDKTPSFSVSEKKQIYHCFSCGRGGNVFSFLQEMEGLSFVEAVGKTAELADVQVDHSIFDRAKENQPAEHSTKGKLLTLYEKAELFYHHILVNTQAGEAAYNHLLDRGLTKESIETFKVGYSPPQREALKMYLENEKLDNPEMLAKSGLFSDRDDGVFYDRFSNRIIFPIKDARGQTVAFSGRAFEQEHQESMHTAKYLNSPETELFNKRRVLFNYDKARASIRREEEVILFEGFMDVISAWQVGVKNGIATMGTSLTEEHVSALDKVTSEIVLAFDGDNAGLEATKRTIDFLTQETPFTINIATFPEKLDPDDYIQEKGVEAFKEFLSHGRDTLMSFLMKYHRNGLNLKNENSRLKYIETILKELTRVTSAVERELYLKQLQDEFNISAESLKEQMYQYIQEQQTIRRNQRQQEKEKKDRPTTKSIIVHQNKPKMTTVLRAENALLHRLFTHDEVWHILESSEKELTFTTEENQLLFLLYDDYYHSHDYPSVQAFMDFLPDEKLKSKVTEIMLLSLSEDIENGEIEDYIHVICDRYPLEDRLKQKQDELKTAERNGDKEKQQSLTLEIINLYRQLKNK